MRKRKRGRSLEVGNFAPKGVGKRQQGRAMTGILLRGEISDGLLEKRSW